MTDPVLDMLLAAVIADPGNDSLRLVFADRLEETGADDARAEFVRVQVELARLGEPGPPACGGYYCDVAGDGQVFHRDCRPFRLRCRAADLLDPRVPFWVPPPFSGRAHAFRASGEVAFVAGSAVWGSVLFRRGFVGEVTLPCAAWGDHGPALVRAAPLGRVRLTDRTPNRSDGDGGRHYWWHGDLPADVYDLMVCDDARPAAPGERPSWKRYPDLAWARSAASDALLAWARSAVPEAAAP